MELQNQKRYSTKRGQAGDNFGRRKVHEMVLIFCRTGERRYVVRAKRSSLPDVEMNPAPGYDPFMPHDLMHLVVEAQLGLKRGIFGQLALGGDAGTFHVPGTQLKSRELNRVRNHQRAKGKKLLREGRNDCLHSEHAAFIFWKAWQRRSSSDKRQPQFSEAEQMAYQGKGVVGASDLSALIREKFDEILTHLDELSSQWSKLPVGGELAVRWPDLKVL